MRVLISQCSLNTLCITTLFGLLPCLSLGFYVKLLFTIVNNCNLFKLIYIQQLSVNYQHTVWLVRSFYLVCMLHCWVESFYCTVMTSTFRFWGFCTLKLIKNICHNMTFNFCYFSGMVLKYKDRKRANVLTMYININIWAYIWISITFQTLKILKSAVCFNNSFMLVQCEQLLGKCLLMYQEEL